MIRDSLCEWIEDFDGIWETTCGETFVFNTGGPPENGFCFCAYCGLKLSTKRYVFPLIEDEK